MLPDNVITLMWMLVFFVIFFIYIDVRLTKFRKEMLDHYLLCENMLKGTGTGTVNSSTLATGIDSPMKKIIPASSFIDSYGVTVINPGGVKSEVDDLVPTREELAYGLKNINASLAGDTYKDAITTNFCDPGWKGSVVGSTIVSNNNEIQGFDETGEYASVSFT